MAKLPKNDLDIMGHSRDEKHSVRYAYRYFVLFQGAEKVADVSEKLTKDNEHLTYTPRKNLRYTISHE